MAKIEGNCTMYNPEEPNYNKEEVAEWKKVRDKLKELDITVRNINKCFNENKQLRKENLNLRNANIMLDSTIAILNKEVDKLEKENARLRDIISRNSEEEYCD